MAVENRDAYELVQPILVSTEGSHEATVIAAALACVTAWREDKNEPCWDEWLSQPFAKSVRRMKPAKLARLLTEQPAGSAVAHVNNATALAYRPMLMADFPAEVARAQVSGTDFPREKWPVLEAHEWVWEIRDNRTLLVVNPELDDTMSTGKQAAQAAHALLGLALTDDSIILSNVRVVRALTPEIFADAVKHARVVIQDAGRTEIKPGSVTFVAL